MLQMTLMRLRLGISFTHLAFQFNVSIPTASSCFYKCLFILYTKLRNLVKWPSRDELRKTMPKVFRKVLGHNKLATIVDCFEVAIEVPSKPLAKSQCWSTYKHRQTIKMLIGITPQGSISFISKAYGGRCSDKFITEDSGILNLLLPGDVILADRGFNLQVEVALLHANLVTPTFVKRARQLDPRDVEFTRRIASVRIYVENVIGLLRKKYLILTNKLSMSTISKETNGIHVIDQIVTVCALCSIDKFVPIGHITKLKNSNKCTYFYVFYDCFFFNNKFTTFNQMLTNLIVFKVYYFFRKIFAQ